jgi:hypothetical protein
MDIKKIIKEEVDEFNWATDVESAEMKTYMVTYRMEMLIEAPNIGEAEKVWESTNLTVPNDEGPIGVKYSSFIDDDGVQETNL